MRAKFLAFRGAVHKRSTTNRKARRVITAAGCRFEILQVQAFKCGVCRERRASIWAERRRLRATAVPLLRSASVNRSIASGCAVHACSQRSRDGGPRSEVPGTRRAPSHSSTATGRSAHIYCAARAIDRASSSPRADRSYGQRKRPDLSTTYIRYCAILHLLARSNLNAWSHRRLQREIRESSNRRSVQQPTVDPGFVQAALQPRSALRTKIARENLAIVTAGTHGCRGPARRKFMA